MMAEKKIASLKQEKKTILQCLGEENYSLKDFKSEIEQLNQVEALSNYMEMSQEDYLKRLLQIDNEIK